MHTLLTAGRIHEARQNEELAREIGVSLLKARDYSPWRRAGKPARWI